MAKARDLKLVATFDVSSVKAGFEEIRKGYEQYSRLVASTKSTGFDPNRMAATAMGYNDAIMRQAKAHQDLNKATEEAAKKAASEKERAAAKESAWSRAQEAESNRIFRAYEASYKRDQQAFAQAEAAKRAEAEATAAKFRAAADAAKQPQLAPGGSGDVATRAAEKAARDRTNIAQRQALYIAKLEYDLQYAVARGYNNQFERFSAVERAKSEYLKKQIAIRYADSEKAAQMIALVDKRYGQARASIQVRELNFADTPFQKHIGLVQKMLGSLGVSAKQSGQAMQQVGFQIGDFATQVASGQGFLRPFIQQGTQLVSMFGAWGAAIGAAGAVLGAFAVYMLNAKDGVDGLSKAIKNASVEDLDRKLQNYTESARVASAVTRRAVQQYDFYAVSALAVSSSHQKVRKEVDSASRALEYIYGSVEKAREAYERLQSQTVKGLKIEAEISGLELKGESVANAVEIQKARNKASLDELKRGFDQERVAVQAWEKGKEESDKQFAERRKREISRINKDEQAAIALENQIGADRVQKIRNDASKKVKDDAKTAASELAGIEFQTQRMRIEAQTAGGARAVALINAEYDERIRAAKGKKAIIAQIEAQRQLALNAQQQAASRREAEEYRRITEGAAALQVRRLEVMNAGDAAMLLSIRQNEEKRRAEAEYSAQLIRDIEEGNYANLQEKYEAHQRSMTTIAEIHAEERRQLTEKQGLEGIRSVQNGLMTLSQIAAETWDIGPLQKTNMWIQRITSSATALYSVYEGMAKIKAAGGLLSFLGSVFGIGAIAAAPATGGASLAVGGAAVGTVLGGSGPTGAFLPKASAASQMPSPSTYLPAPKTAASLSKAAPNVTIGGTTIVFQNAPTAQEAREIGREIGLAQANALSRVGWYGPEREFRHLDRVSDYQGVPS